MHYLHIPLCQLRQASTRSRSFPIRIGMSMHSSESLVICCQPRWANVLQRSQVSVGCSITIVVIGAVVVCNVCASNVWVVDTQRGHASPKIIRITILE